MLRWGSGVPWARFPGRRRRTGGLKRRWGGGEEASRTRQWGGFPGGSGSGRPAPWRAPGPPAGGMAGAVGDRRPLPRTLRHGEPLGRGSHAAGRAPPGERPAPPPRGRPRQAGRGEEGGGLQVRGRHRDRDARAAPDEDQGLLRLRQRGERRGPPTHRPSSRARGVPGRPRGARPRALCGDVHGAPIAPADAPPGAAPTADPRRNPPPHPRPRSTVPRSTPTCAPSAWGAPGPSRP